MGVISKTKFSEISKSHYLFSTYNYFRLRKLIDEKPHFQQVRLGDFFEIISGFAFSSNDYTDEGVSVCRIGDISKTNELLVEEMLKLPEEYFDVYDKYRILQNDILIGLTGDGKFFKTCLVNLVKPEILLNQRVGILRLKDGIDNISVKFISLLFNTDEVQNQIRIVAMGKTQKNVSPFDILNVKIPKIDLTQQISIIEKITPVENKIKQLKTTALKPLNAINLVFSNHFKINFDEIQEIDKTRVLSIPLSNVKINNSGLRSSLRWNKMQYIQKIIYSKIDCIETLGKHIQSTKNGWSPLSVEGGEGVPVLGQENFSFDGILKVEPSKATEETRNNIEDFFIKKGDFFVSRGNTVDYVALASIVNADIYEDILYPDLYIRLELDETSINKEYLCYIFNSFFGRLYFKYVAKGKNQTMVKVSSTELLNFRLPIPSIEEQEQLVELIKIQLEEQNGIDQQIEEKQKAINKITEDAIKQEKK